MCALCAAVHHHAAAAFGVWQSARQMASQNQQNPVVVKVLIWDCMTYHNVAHVQNHKVIEGQNDLFL